MNGLALALDLTDLAFTPLVTCNLTQAVPPF
jgi:hypothetical protein